MRYLSLVLAALISSLSFSCNGQPSNMYFINSSGVIKNSINDIVVIDSVIDLKGGVLELTGCRKLVFERDGSINNGKVIIDLSISIIEGGVGIFNNVVLLPKQEINNSRKTSLPFINAQWFGARGDREQDNSSYIQRAIDAGHAFSVPVFLPRGYYLFYKTLRIYDGDVIRGEDAGRITLNHQTGASFLRYCGKDKEMISVEGSSATIENLLIAGNTLYQSNGISLVNNAGLCFNLNNVLIANAKNGIDCTLKKDEGLSCCIWEKVSLCNCVRGFSVEINNDSGQYITYNCFYNMMVSCVLEKGVYMHCRAINSCVFRDCLFENIAYGPAYNKKYENIEKASIFVKNEAKQGSITIDGGYFENIYFSKGGEPKQGQDSSYNAVFSVENTDLSITNTRFANTRTIVNSKGYDIISISNCLDNGFYKDKNKDIVPICYGNEKTVLSISNYTFSDNEKEVYTIDRGSFKIIDVNNIRIRE